MPPLNRILERPVDLARLELLEVVIPQVEVFRSAVGVRRERRALLVRWWDSDGSWGLGECSCRPDPFFSGEFVAGAWQVLETWALALLPRQGCLGEVEVALRKIRGWPFATSAVLDAVLDLGRRRGLPDALDAWSGPRLSRVPVGISLGLFPDHETALARVSEAVDAGYRRIKLKVSPGMDPAVLEAIRSAYPDIHLSLDANGSLAAGDRELLKALARLRPAVLEQPFPPGRLDLCQDLRREMPSLRLCLDESLTDLGLVVSAHRLGALDEVNLKPGRVGGQLEALRILDYCQQERVPIWVGGMFETSLGRLANLRLAARVFDATAHDLSPSSRYFTRDLVTTPLEMDPDGHIDLGGETPSCIDEQALAELTTRRVELVKE